MTAQTPDPALARRDAILQAVSYAASGFLRTSDWRESTERLLGRLGLATEVHRIYVFENGTGPAGELTASQRFEWVAAGTPSQIDNPELQNVPYEAGFGRWEAILRRGDVVLGLVRDLPDDEREFLSAQGIRAILAGDTWWGFMGFDD